MPVPGPVHEVELLDRDGPAEAPRGPGEVVDVKVPVLGEAVGPQEGLSGDGVPPKGPRREDEALNAILRREVGPATIKGAVLPGPLPEARRAADATTLAVPALLATLAPLLAITLPVTRPPA